MQNLAYRQQLVLEKNQKLIEAQLKPCTFQPKLDTRSLTMQQENHIPIVEKTFVHLEKAKNSVKDSQTIKLEKELSQCTFHPSTNYYDGF